MCERESECERERVCVRDESECVRDERVSVLETERVSV